MKFSIRFTQCAVVLILSVALLISGSVDVCATVVPGPVGPMPPTSPVQPVMPTQPKPVGVGEAEGIVRSIAQKGLFIYVAVATGQDTKVFYATIGRDVAPMLLSLKPGDVVQLEYVLGTPVKYGTIMAMPLAGVTVTGKAAVPPQRLLGVATHSGRVKAVRVEGTTVFLVLNVGSETGYYYTGVRTALGNELLKLKPETRVQIANALCGTIKFDQGVASPLTGLIRMKEK